MQEEERALVMDVWKVFDKKGENQINVIDLPTVFQVYSYFFLAAKICHLFYLPDKHIFLKRILAETCMHFDSLRENLPEINILLCIEGRALILLF